MFSNNNQISKRQIYRLATVGNLGQTMLVLPKLAAKCGMIAPILAGILACAYICAMNFMAAHVNKNKIIMAILRGFMSVKYFLILIVMILILSDIVSDMLLPGISAYVVCGACMLTALYVCGNIENISRGAEVLYYFVIIPVLLLCALAVSSIDMSFYRESAFRIFVNINENFKNILIIPAVVFLLTPAELAAGFLIETKDKKDMPGEALKAAGILTAISAVVYFQAYGILGFAGIRAEKYPLIGLARLTGLPGGFLERQDTLIGIFLVISIIYNMALSVYAISESICAAPASACAVPESVMSEKLRKKLKEMSKEKSKEISKEKSKEISKETIKVKLKEKVKMNGKMKGKRSKLIVRAISAAAAVVISSAIITGNILPDFSGLKKSVSTEIENRNYVLAMGIDYEEGKYRVSMAFADFTKLSGEAPDGSANNRSFYMGESIEASAFSSGEYDISREYGKVSDKIPDFSHVKVIILGKNLTQDSSMTEYHRKNVDGYLRAMTRIGRNTLAALSDKTAEEIIKCEENVKNGAGMYIYSMLKNNGYKKCNISRLTNLPLITIADGLPALVKYQKAYLKT